MSEKKVGVWPSCWSGCGGAPDVIHMARSVPTVPLRRADAAIRFDDVLGRLLTHAAANLDRAMVTAATRMLSRARVATLDHKERVAGLRRVAAAYCTPDHMLAPEGFFPRIATTPAVLPVDEEEGARVLELTWDSAFEPFDRDIAARYLRNIENRTAAARLYTTGEPNRPAIVLIHGYLCGQWRLEEKLWPINAMLRWGLDVTLFVLPFHGVRARSGMGAPPFPAADPRVTIEGFRQSIGDLRVLTDFLRARGAPHVGLMGMSLGGYTAALACTLDAYDFLVPMIPLGSIADFARDGGKLGSAVHERAEQHRALDAAYAVVSPYARPAKVTGDRVLVVTGEGDRITPAQHASRLARHFDARTHVFHGGHVLQFGRNNAFRAVGSMLRKTGVIARH